MVCSPIVFHCKCIIPLQIEDWLITQRNCGHVVEPSFIYAWHACMQAQKLKNVCSNQYSQQLSSVVVWLLAGWLTNKLLKERNFFLTLQQLDYIFIFMFFMFFIFFFIIISIISIIMSSSSSSSFFCTNLLLLSFGAQNLPTFVGSKFRWNFFLCVKFILGFVDDGGWRVSKFGIQLGFQILEKMG